MAKHLDEMSDRTRHYEKLRRDYYHFVHRVRPSWEWDERYKAGTGKHRA